ILTRRNLKAIVIVVVSTAAAATAFIIFFFSPYRARPPLPPPLPPPLLPSLLLLLALLCLPAATTASTAFFFFFFFFFSPCHAHPVSCPIRPRRSADSSRVPINNFCNRYDKFCPFYKLVWMMRNIIHFNTLANQAVERGAGSDGQKITYSIIKH
ncbi:uncharacterized protein LOC122043652, partial [Zingiber officinale]|uniref:uncharacterized protein LOC122043652 n=1 Tax=Zingiber officinale TaxID=94328 RepID=UPI001C4AD011